MRAHLRMSAAARGIALGLLIAATATPVRVHAADSTAVARGRQSWTSDRVPLRVGDLVTVVVDEQTEAREHVSKVAQGDRGQKASLLGHIDTGGTSTPSRYDVGLSTGLQNNSRDVGDAQRTGDLTSVLTARVTGFASDGVVKIEAKKQVTVDGRAQVVMLQGLIRTADVAAGNQVRSNRIADAVITYKGKKLAPNSSLVGRLLGMVWP